MSIEINYKVPTVQTAIQQVRESFKGTTPTRSKVIAACKKIYDVKDAEFESIARKVWEGVKAVPSNSIDRLPPEVLKKILGYAEAATLGSTLFLTSPEMNVAAKAVIAEGMQTAPAMAFGAKAWLDFMGADVGAEPPLPEDIESILASQCPFSESGETVAKTHLLVLIPETVNGELLNFATLGQLFRSKFPHVGVDDVFREIDSHIYSQMETRCKSRWVLMTRDVIAHSRNKSVEKQQVLLASKGKGKYGFPPALSAVVCILTAYAGSGGKTCLYGRIPSTLTTCKDVYEEVKLVSAVGGFSDSGVIITLHAFDSTMIGVAGFRELVAPGKSHRPLANANMERFFYWPKFSF